MVLQVGSPDRNTWVNPDKSDVLNGQAMSALNLVPYFAFATMGMSRHEIDFLLIDDPSQSFDTAHIDYLLELLQSVSETAQIVLATHEKHLIGSSLRSSFREYNAIEIRDFTVEDGPHIAYVSSLAGES